MRCPADIVALTIRNGESTSDTRRKSPSWCVMPARFVMIAVSDTGSGMDWCTRQTSLRTVLHHEAAIGRGTGLGLATIYGIVKQSRGAISGLQRARQGSTACKLYLPAISTGCEQRTDAPTAPRPATGTETILVVEDGDDVRRFIAQTLNRHGYRVHEAATEADALTYARDPNRPVDLLLTDVVLTGLSGRGIARRLAADRPSLRVIYMSGYTDDAIVHRGVLEPGRALLQKPFSARQLLTKIREVLDLDTPPPW